MGDPVALQPGGQGRPPRCRAAAPRDLCAIFFANFFSQKPLPPGSRAAEVYSCKFPNQKYIFIKNKNIKYKNKKPRPAVLSARPRQGHVAQHSRPGRAQAAQWGARSLSSAGSGHQCVELFVIVYRVSMSPIDLCHLSDQKKDVLGSELESAFRRDLFIGSHSSPLAAHSGPSEANGRAACKG